MNTRVAPRRNGFTLTELVIVLAVIGMALTIVAIDGPSLLRGRSRTADPLDALRRSALSSGRDTSAILLDGTNPRLVTILADGRVVSP